MPDPQTQTSDQQTTPSVITPQAKPQDYSLHLGPDKKFYKFPNNWTQKQADKWFEKKGIKESSGRDTPEKDSLLTAIVTGKLSGEAKKKLGSAGLDYVSSALPSAGAMAFSAAAGSKSNPVGIGMAALGGGAGEAANQLIQRIAFSRDSDGNPVYGPTDTSMNAAKNIAFEAMKQGGLEATGRAGAAFFKWLPHAKIKNGIPLLPSDMGQGGRMGKYVEDFLSNVFPSADVMKTFKVEQGKAIEKAGRNLAEGFSKFTGDSKATGDLIQGTLQQAKEQILNKLTAGTKGKLTKAILNSAAYKDYQRIFEDAFVSEIAKKRNPELIAGLIRNGGSKDIAMIKEALKEAPDVLDVARSRILKDILSETMTKSADPAVRKVLQNKGLVGGLQSFTDKTFAGKTFVHEMDSIGEARLKDIFGDTGYKSIKNFMETVKGVSGSDGGASMIGRFYNLTYILGPLRAVNPVGLAGQAVVLRTMARIISSPEGIEAINQYVRATASQSPKLINAATEVYKKQVERAYREQKIEEQMIKNHFENQGKGI